MKRSAKAQQRYDQITPSTKLGDLRTLAKAIKKDHGLALELWHAGEYLPRQLAILIMDKKQLSEPVVDQLLLDINLHPHAEKMQLVDWLMANQLSKDKATIAMMQSWRKSDSILKRRCFWYYQGRLRWVGQTPPPDTQQLLATIESDITQEAPDVQWAMNFTAAQIGIFDPEFRARCIALGENTGLYRDEIVARGCTPNYLPALIAIQVKKLQR